MSVIYFIQAGDKGPIKIGCTADVDIRLSKLQCGSPQPLRLLGTVPGSFAEETSLHRALAFERVGGEWFSEDAAKAALDRLSCASDPRAEIKLIEAEQEAKVASQIAPRASVQEAVKHSFERAVETHGFHQLREMLSISEHGLRNIVKGYSMPQMSTFANLLAFCPDAFDEMLSLHGLTSAPMGAEA